MSTLAEPGVLAGTGHTRFYVRSAIACLAIAVIGFAPTYWIPLVTGKLEATPLTHVHAMLFHAWLLLFWRQASLAATGRIAVHRKWGWLGAALVAAMVAAGLGLSVHSMRMFDATGQGPAARVFAIVPVTAVLLFAALFVVAVLNRRNPETHKRFMLAATASLVQPAFGRLFVLFIAPAGPPAPPPVFVTLPPGILADLVIVAGMIHDKKTRGRVHRAYWIALGVILAVQVLRVPLSTTGAWKWIANAMVAVFP